MKKFHNLIVNTGVFVMWMMLLYGILHVGGWSAFYIKTSVYDLNKYIDGSLILDSLVIYKQGFGILINNSLYGFEFTNRFFYSPIISWLLFSVGAFFAIAPLVIDWDGEFEEFDGSVEGVAFSLFMFCMIFIVFFYIF